MSDLPVITRLTVPVFADLVAEKLRERLELRQQVSLAVPGGTTPRQYLTALAGCDLEWNRVHVFLTDERWVEPASPQSNENLIRECLLQGRAARARFHGIFRPGLSIAQAAEAAGLELAEQSGGLDLILLGMGADTHIASIFPENPVLSLPGVAYAPVTSGTSDFPRVTLTPAAIKQALQVMLVIAGEDKEYALQQAWQAEDSTGHPVLLLKDRPVDTLLIYSLTNEN